MNPFSRHLSRSSRRPSQGARNVPALLLGLSILVSLALPPSRSEASGLNLTVNTLADEDDGIGVGSISLRDAINAANGLPGPHFISFSVTGTIALTGPLPTIVQSIVVVGPGETQLIVDADSTGRPFLISSAGNLTISALEVRNGVAQGGNGGGVDTFPGGGGGGAGMGGAFFVDGGTLTVSDVIVRNSDAIGGQGGSSTGVGSASGGGGGGAGGNGGDGNSGSAGSGGALGAGSQGGAGGVSTAGGSGGFGGGGGGGGTSDGGFAGGNGGFGGGGGGGAIAASAGTGGLHGGTGGTGIGTGAGGGGGGGLGGGIFLRSGTLSLTNVHFVGNNAMKGSGLSGGSPGEGKGGALYVLAGTVTDGGGNTFQGNSATDDLDSPGDDDHVFGTIVVPVEVRGIEVD